MSLTNALSVRPKRAYLSVQVRNSIDGSVLAGNASLHTTKADTKLHGYGIRSVVGKYDGMIRFLEEDGEFVCLLRVCRV